MPYLTVVGMEVTKFGIKYPHGLVIWHQSATWLQVLELDLTNCHLAVKGVYSKPSGNCIVAPNLCFLN